jgi:hypothetical protein
MEPLHAMSLSLFHMSYICGDTVPLIKLHEHGSPVKIDHSKLDLVRLFDTEVWKN